MNELRKNENLTMEELSEILANEPTVRSAGKRIKYLPPKPVKLFCGNCGSSFISDNAHWYKVVTGRDPSPNDYYNRSEGHWNFRFLEMTLTHIVAMATINHYRSRIKPTASERRGPKPNKSYIKIWRT